MSVKINSSQFDQSLKIIKMVELQIENGYHLSDRDIVQYKEAIVQIRESFNELQQRVKNLDNSR